MYDKNENIFKITTIILAIVLLIVLGYVALDKYKAYQSSKIQLVYSTAYNQGVTDLINQLYKSTDNCGVAPFNFQNKTRSVADVDCIQKAIQQGASQQKTV